jgi:hypothetical protein
MQNSAPRGRLVRTVRKDPTAPRPSAIAGQLGNRRMRRALGKLALCVKRRSKVPAGVRTRIYPGALERLATAWGVDIAYDGSVTPIPASAA